MHQLAATIVLTLATSAHATLLERDFDSNGATDGIYDTSTNLTWSATPISGSWFIRYDLADLKIGGVTGWRMASAPEYHTLVFGSLGNTPESFQVGAQDPGPFVLWRCSPSWTDNASLLDEVGYSGEGWDGRGLLSIPLNVTLDSLVVLEGDVGAPAISPIPEPETWTLMGAGLALLAAFRRRRPT